MNAFDVAYALAGIAAAPWLLRKRRRGWRERLGHADPSLRRTASAPGSPRIPRVLIHAVSVGEVNAIRGLIPLLREAGLDVVVSATTDTGLARARELFERNPAIGAIDAAPHTAHTSPHGSPVVRYPLDFSRSVRRFLDVVAPDVVALVELEVWPNFVRECTRRGVTIGVINGRLSARSFRGYRRARFVIGRTFARLAFAAVQDETYARRFRDVGTPPDAITVTGSMKWDSVAIGSHLSESARARSAALAAAMGIRADKPLVVAGSTGPGEEELLHHAVGPGVQLLCAPRKPERCDEAARALDGCVRRSRAEKRDGCARFLLDTIGELRDAYALADVVVIGRSFCGLHGSDPVEPASMGKPVIIGPEFSDFENAVDSLARGGTESQATGPGIVITTRDRLPRDISRLLADEKERERLGRAGLEAVRREQGVTARHADLIVRTARATRSEQRR